MEVVGRCPRCNITSKSVLDMTSDTSQTRSESELEKKRLTDIRTKLRPPMPGTLSYAVR